MTMRPFHRLTKSLSHTLSLSHKQRICLATTGVALALSSRPAFGVVNSWQSAIDGQWSDATKWSQGHVPAGTEDAILGFANVITFNTNSTPNSLDTIADLQIVGGTLGGSQANDASPLSVSGGTLTLNGGQLSGLTLAAGAGTIVVASNGGNVITSLIINHDINVLSNGYAQLFGTSTLSANIELTGGGNGLQLRDGNANLVVSSNGLIHGASTVFQVFGGATVTDNGTIAADQNGATLTLATSNIVGSGTLQSTNGGVLSISGLLNGSGLFANAAAGSTVQIDGGGLSGTLAGSSGTGITFTGNGNNVVSAATINGDLTFNGNGYAQAFGVSTLSSATIHMAGTSNGIQLRDGNASLMISSTAAVRGFGTIFQTFGGANLVNNGTISADSAGNTLLLTPSNILGSGTFEAKSGGVLSIGGLFNGNNAIIRVDNNPNSAVLVNAGGLTGSFAASTGSGISFANNGNNSISFATIGADLTFAGGAYAQVFGVNTINGTVNMSGTGNGIQLRDGNATLTVSSTGSIRGFGAVFQAFGGTHLEDEGIISADASGQTLTLSNSDINGAGTFDARSGGTLAIAGLLTGSNAIVRVDNSPGSAVIVNGGGIAGSFAPSTGSGISFANNGNNQITGATIGADLTFAGGAYAQVFGVNTETGTIHMSGTGNGIQLRDGNATLTIASAGSIRGFGTVFEAFGGTNLANNGTISADNTSATLALNTSNIFGSGTFEAKNGGVLSIGGVLNGNNAIVRVDANPSSAVLVNGGGLTGSFAASTGGGISFANNGNNRVTSATINADLTFAGAAYAQLFGTTTENGAINMSGTGNGIQLRDGNATLTIGTTGLVHGFGQIFEAFGGTHVVNNGSINADTAGQTLALNNSSVINSGFMNVASGATLQVGAALNQTAGHTRVDGTMNLAHPFPITGGILSGAGTIVGAVDNSAGTLSPGDSPGILTITGSYTQESGGTFFEELGGTAAGAGYDQLSVSGAANVAGMIDVDLVNGFVPSIGQTFDVILRGSGSGTFSTTTSDDPGLMYTVNYLSTKVQITITAVPEPASVGILCGAGVFVRRRRRRG